VGVMNMNEQNQSTTSNIDFVEMRQHTLVETKEGNIAVIHEITLGDIIISVILAAMMIFMFLERFMRS
jgi:hypothetical protein